MHRALVALALALVVVALAAAGAAAAATPSAPLAPPPPSPPPVVRASEPTATAEGEHGRSELGGSGLVRAQSAFVVGERLAVSARSAFFRTPTLTLPAGVDEHWQTQFGASAAPLDWLELAATLRSATHEQRASAQQRYFLVNDLTVSGKAALRWLDGLVGGGVVLGLRLPPPLLRADPPFAGVSPWLGAVGSAELARFGLPLVAHVNTAFFLDESVRFDDGTGDATRRFALDISTYNRWRTVLGLEGRWRTLGVGLRPFLELALDAHLGAPTSIPARLTPGVRVLPWQGLFVDAAADVGLTRPRAAGVLPVPPWQLSVSIGYQASWAQVGARTEYVDRVQVQYVDQERVVERVVAAPETHGRLEGQVVDAATRAPILDAIVAPAGRERSLSGEDGRFRVERLVAGDVKLVVSHQGYAPRETTVAVAAGAVASVEVPLVALPPLPPAPMSIRGTVLAEPEAKIEATVSAPAAGIEKRTDDSGQYLLTVPSGAVALEVSAPGFQTQGRRISGAPGDSIVWDVVLRPAPKKMLVLLKQEKLEITKQVHFAAGKDVILPDSGPLLDQVAAVLLEAEHLTLVRIEGHTDSDGDDTFNLDLSERRAASVRRALLERGVAPERLKAVGFGETRPIADNRKAAGKARNRRVEFMIEEQASRPSTP